MRISRQPGFSMIARALSLYGYALLFGAWGVGVLFGLLRVLWEYRRLRRVRASCHPIEDASVLGAYGEALDALRLRKKPQLLASDHVPAPMAVGLLSPVILVPATLGRTLSFEKLRMVLLHELLHIKRHDLLVGLYQRLLNVLWFFHPVIRYLNGRTNRACEDQCDGLVVEHTGAPVVYARALTELIQNTNDRSMSFPVAAGLASRSGLVARVQDILDGIPVGSMPRWGVPAGVLAVCVLVGLLSSVTILGGSEGPPVAESVSLSGIVRDPAGAPVEGARVHVFRGGSWVSWGKATTTSDGRFEIDGLLPGTFSAAAEVRGYAPSVLLDIPGGARDLEFVLNEGGAITGKVVSEEGEPVPEVMVTAEYHSNILHSVWGKTDRNGVYRIPRLAEGMYSMRVNVRYSPSAYGKLVADPEGADRVARVREGETRGGVDFVLIPGRRVSGRITYRETGKPAARISVTLMGRDSMDTMTDEEGRYTFSGVPPGRYWVTTDLEGYAGMSCHRFFDVTMEEDVRDMDVALIHKGALSVVVQDEEGHPIPGARVRYEGAGELYGMPGQPSEDRTDREGRCRYEGVCTEWPEPEMLWADHPEYAFGVLLVEPIREREDREIILTLSRGGTLKGRVTDWEGEPVSGARIRILGPVEHPVWDPKITRTAFTDRRGAYRAEHLPIGALKVVVDHVRPLFIPEASTVEIRRGKVTTWDVSVRRGGTLLGRVVDRQGRPVGGVAVEVSPRGFHQWEIRTDGDGFYRADHLPPREYRVSVRTLRSRWDPSGVERKSVHIVEGQVARADLTVESEEGG